MASGIQEKELSEAQAEASSGTSPISAPILHFVELYRR